MMLLALAAARRLAWAVRVPVVRRQRALYVMYIPQMTLMQCGTVGLYARRLMTESLPTESPDARAEMTAYARLTTTIERLAGASLARFDKMDPEIREKKIETTVAFLEQRLLMKRVTAIRTLALSPLLMARSHETLERKLNWLTQQGMNDDALCTIVRRFPPILGLSEESLEATKQWFLDLGIAPSRIPYTFRMAPQVIGLTRENMDLKVRFLRGVGLDNGQIRRVVQNSPNVFTYSVKNMASKVAFAKRLGVTDHEVVKLVTNVPQFLSLNMDDIQRKLQAFDDLFGEGEGLRLWLSNPPLIGSNTEQLRRTFEYLTNVVGMTPDRISQQVRLIMRNVDRLVRPRYEYLLKVQSRDLDKLIWIRLSETKFVHRYPDYANFLASEFKPKTT